MTSSPLPVDPLSAVVRDLADVMDLPLAERAAAFAEMHRVLAQALATTADRGAAAPGTSVR